MINISKTEIAALKGISIFIIVMHNVTHQLSGIAENEFRFSTHNLITFFEGLIINPIESIFSFLGWVGVSMFVFASGYGLTLKYDKKIPNKLTWILKHYAKLLILLIPCFLIFKTYPFLRDPTSINITDFILESTLLLNIYNPYAISPLIYWYIGMAFQMYLLFLVLNKVSTYHLYGIAIFAISLLAFLPDEYVSYCRFNFIGWLPEFIFGIFTARKNENMKLYFHKNFLIIVSLLLFLLSPLTKFTFFLCGLGFVGLLLPLRKKLVELKIVVFLGNISAIVYILHPILRQSWHYISEWGEINLPSVIVSLLILTASVLFAIPYSVFYKQMLKYTLRLLPKEKLNFLSF